jgi:hypothetical protein
MALRADPIDILGEVSEWHPVASGQARLTVAADIGAAGQAALRLDYDFDGGGGFVVARRTVACALP